MHSGAAVILVSNNTYRLGPRLGAGTRPRVDDGLLGITILAGPHERSHGLARFRLPWRQWNAPTFVINSDAPVPVGVDGESMHIAPPLQFTIRPGVLRVRIAPQHPGASPSAAQPEGLIDALTMLWHLALGQTRATCLRIMVEGCPFPKAVRSTSERWVTFAHKTLA